MRKLPFLILWLTLPLTFAQSQQRPTAAPVAAHKRSTAPPTNLSDAQIQGNIQARLSRSKIGRNGFKFSTLGGTTTIEGKTDIIQHKGAATRIARTSGARQVLNHIVISEAAKQKARANLDTGRRRAQVTRGDPRSQAH